MLLGQCLGPSATLYSSLATEGSSYAGIVGRTFSVTETCYNPMNVILWIILAVVIMLQPLYVIPALSVVGMKLKDIWGFMAFICVFWIIIVCLGLYFLPMII